MEAHPAFLVLTADAVPDDVDPWFWRVLIDLSAEFFSPVWPFCQGLGRWQCAGCRWTVLGDELAAH
jgi:hypothetical protein